MAIFTALLSIPLQLGIEICTDSEASIQSINNIFSDLNCRSILKMKNYTILLGIKDIVLGKQLKVSFTKIKGHSNDIHNDAADLLAKEALSDVILNRKWLISLDNLDCTGGNLEY